MSRNKKSRSSSRSKRPSQHIKRGSKSSKSEILPLAAPQQTTNILAAYQKNEYCSHHSLSPAQIEAIAQMPEDIKTVFLTEWQAEGENHRGAFRFALEADVKDTRRGMWFAFTTVLVAFVISCVLILTDHSVTGSLFGAVGVGGLVRSFIQGRHEAAHDQQQPTAAAVDDSSDE